MLSVLLAMASCRSARIATSAAGTTIKTDASVAAYVQEYADMAIREMERTGVPASITLAQGIIESDFGRSRLAREANNHFGIKCHKDWKGMKIYHDDDRRNECFRKYSDVEESYRDHSDFLRQGSRYQSLFDLSEKDYKGWARGLRKAGYATNPKYAGMLINMIEENSLFIYDSKQKVRKEKINQNRVQDEVIVETHPERRDDIDNFVITRVSRVQINNRIEFVVVEEGDSYQSLMDEFELLSWEISRYNELEMGVELVPGQPIYLQPKRNKAEVGFNYHTLKEGETMYSVSQKYGIKLKVLYERNRMENGSEATAGKELWLRKNKPEGFR